jgi:hypothetical protein
MSADTRPSKHPRLLSQLVLASIAFIAYNFAVDFWRFGAITPGVDDAMRPVFKFLGIGLAVLVLLGHALWTVFWKQGSLLASFWVVAAVVGAAVTTWGLQTSWGQRCNQCSLLDGALFVGAVALPAAVATVVLSIVIRKIRRQRGRVA